MAKKNRYYRLDNIEITDISSEGKGIVKIDGKVLFIEKAITGDVIHLQSKQSSKSFEKGKIISIHKPSELRREPHCIHHDTCGGCKMQHLDYAQQLIWKQTVSTNALERIGGFEGLNILPILGCDKTENYRNKLDYGACNKRWLTSAEVNSEESFNRNAIGFHISGSYDKLIDIKECHHMPMLNNDIRNFIKLKADELEISYFDILEKHGCLRGIIFRNNVKGEWMVCFQVFDMEDNFMVLLEAIKNEFPQVISLQYAINRKANDTIYDLDFEIYNGQDFIYEYLGEKKFKITPKSFFQTNTEQCVKLYDMIGKLAGIKDGDTIYDLYCGVGSIGIYLAEKAKKIVGIELVEEAIKDARMNAKINGMENCEYHAADMRDLFSSEFIAKAGMPDIIITDPPRAGMHPDVVHQLAHSGCPKIIYVSCNPQTMANDMKALSLHYNIELIQPVDMFPHTIHIENIAVLIKK